MTLKRYANCMEVREDFSALLDDELTLEEREQIEGHLSECAECLRELDALKQVDVAYSVLSTVNAPEDFEEGVRRAIRPRTLWFPALGRARPTKWMRPVAAMAALLLVMFGAMFVLQPTEPERFEIAKVRTDETPALEAEKGVFSPAPTAPAEAPYFAVGEEARAAEPSRVPVVDVKGDAQLADADDARERLVRDRLDAPEAAEFDAARFRSQSKRRAEKEGIDQKQMQSLGYVDAVGAGERGGRLAGKRPAADAAVPLRGVGAQAQESSQITLEKVVLFGAKSELQSADTAQVVTRSEALQERDEVLGQPFNEEPADMELRKTASSARRLGLAGGSVADGERSLAQSFEDRVEGALDQLVPIKTVRVRSYKVVADGSWVEQGYDGEPTTLLKRGSKDVEALIALDPDIRRIVQRPVRAVFQVAGKWYTLEAVTEGN